MKNEQGRWVELDDSDLQHATGGMEYHVDVPWDWYLASPSCRGAVKDAAQAAADQGGGTEGVLDAVDGVWGGPRCDYYGWL
jgi:hypothetical protein